MNPSKEERDLARELRETERQWFQVLEALVLLAVGVKKDREQAVRMLCDSASDPRLARRIVMAMETDASCIAEAPELYWTAQLTLKGEKHVLMQMASDQLN